MSEQSELITGDLSPATVVVSRVVACPVKRVWKELISVTGAEALLGPGARFGEKGQTWASTDGRSGVVRTLHPLEEIRFTCRRGDQSGAGSGGPSMVQIDLLPSGDATTLTVTHSNLGDVDPEQAQERWQHALTRIGDCLTI